MSAGETKVPQVRIYRRGRLRRALFWIGVTVSAVSLGISLASGWYVAAYRLQVGTDFWQLCLGYGCLYIAEDWQVRGEYARLAAEQRSLESACAEARAAIRAARNSATQPSADVLSAFETTLDELTQRLAFVDRVMADIPGPSATPYVTDGSAYYRKAAQDLAPHLTDRGKEHLAQLAEQSHRNALNSRKLIDRHKWGIFARPWLSFRPSFVYICVPLWIPFLFGVALIAPHLLRRRRAGFCAICGYNLTGNVSGRCPECGANVAGSSHIATTDIGTLSAREPAKDDPVN